MKLSDFNYDLAADLIAQHPLKERDSSRLLVLHRKTGPAYPACLQARRQADSLEHRFFKDIVSYLDPGDLLVLNNTKVIPSRLSGAKPSGGKVEITLLKELGRNSWEALVKGVHEGMVILPDSIRANVTRIERSLAKVVFEFNIKTSGHEPDIRDKLNGIGVMPLPVYIKRESAEPDKKVYQTVYAKEEGAVAAPTAGLHFTDTLLDAIKGKGVKIETVTLHVGYGTFKPVTSEDIEDHKMDEEYYEIPETTAFAVNSTRSEGRRVIAVGTTVTRTLESAATPLARGPACPVGRGKGGVVKPGTGKTSIFIYPGYEFRIVDALITNFHLPGSTPMMLASAFSGINPLKSAYYGAQKAGYRFFSYGDAMLMI